MLFELALKAFKQGESIRRCPCKSCKNPVFVKPPDFAGIGLHDGIAQGDLAIATDDYLVASANRDDSCSAILFHLSILLWIEKQMGATASFASKSL